MPYKLSDPTLPKAVKKLPKKLRQLWIEVFNATIAKSKDDDESAAFKAAWGAVRRAGDKRGKKMPDKNKSFSLGDLQSTVRRAFRRQYGNNVYVYEVRDDHLIVEVEADSSDESLVTPLLYKVAYEVTMKQAAGDQDLEVVDQVTFAPRDEWVQVIRTFVALKMYDDPVEEGRKRWLAISSGGFQDREGEIVSTAFLEDAVQRAEKSNDRGEFWAYHFPGTAIGSCDFQELHEGFLLESGLMYETPMAEKAMHYMEKHPDAGVSIRFMYRNQTKDGVYLPPGAIIERSLLPPGKEAFPWSGITLKEFQTMDKTLNEQKRKALAEMIGEDEAKQVLESLEAGSDALKEAGVRFKEFKAPDQETAEPDETLKESDEVKKEDTPAEDFEFVLSAVALDSIAAKVNERFMPAFKELVQPLIDQNAELRTVVKAMSEDLAHFAEAEETRIAEKVADLPKATIRRIVRPTRAKAKEDAGDGDETGDKTDLIQSGLDTLYS